PVNLTGTTPFRNFFLCLLVRSSLLFFAAPLGETRWILVRSVRTGLADRDAGWLAVGATAFAATPDAGWLAVGATTFAATPVVFSKGSANGEADGVGQLFSTTSLLVPDRFVELPPPRCSVSVASSAVGCSAITGSTVNSLDARLCKQWLSVRFSVRFRAAGFFTKGRAVAPRIKRSAPSSLMPTAPGHKTCSAKLATLI
ncbi:unnamed protein product, partial [Ectocarpus sp. 4 AP-2014]